MNGGANSDQDKDALVERGDDYFFRDERHRLMGVHLQVGVADAALDGIRVVAAVVAERFGRLVFGEGRLGTVESRRVRAQHLTLIVHLCRKDLDIRTLELCVESTNLVTISEGSCPPVVCSASCFDSNWLKFRSVGRSTSSFLLFAPTPLPLCNGA